MTSAVHGTHAMPRLLVHPVALLMVAACLDMHEYSQAAFMLRQALISSCSLMQAPLFTIKSKLFAKSTFVIGYDTAIRLIMPKYYGSEAKMLLELAAMRYRWAACVANLSRSLLELRPCSMIKIRWLSRCLHTPGGWMGSEILQWTSPSMRFRGCNLIVAGRVDDGKTFRTMSDVTLPDGLDTLVSVLVRSQAAVLLLSCCLQHSHSGTPNI